MTCTWYIGKEIIVAAEIQMEILVTRSFKKIQLCSSGLEPAFPEGANTNWATIQPGYRRQEELPRGMPTSNYYFLKYLYFSLFRHVLWSNLLACVLQRNKNIYLSDDVGVSFTFLQAADTGIPLMATTVLAPPLMGAVYKRLLPSCAHHLTQPHGSSPLAKLCSLCL